MEPYIIIIIVVTILVICSVSGFLIYKFKFSKTNNSEDTSALQKTTTPTTNDSTQTPSDTPGAPSDTPGTPGDTPSVTTGAPTQNETPSDTPSDTPSVTTGAPSVTTGTPGDTPSVTTGTPGDTPSVTTGTPGDTPSVTTGAPSVTTGAPSVTTTITPHTIKDYTVHYLNSSTNSILYLFSNNTLYKTNLNISGFTTSNYDIVSLGGNNKIDKIYGNMYFNSCNILFGITNNNLYNVVTGDLLLNDVKDMYIPNILYKNDTTNQNKYSFNRRYISMGIAGNSTNFISLYIVTSSDNKLYMILYDFVNNIFNDRKILIDGEWKKIVTNGLSTLGINAQGALYNWGVNKLPNEWISGEFVYVNSGFTTANFSLLPLLLSNRPFKDVFIIQDSFFCLLETGTLYGWGNNVNGRLGINIMNNDLYFKPNPTQITGGVININAHLVNYFNTTDFFISMIKNDSTLWTWGFNKNYKTGIIQLNDLSLTWTITPEQVPGLWKKYIANPTLSLGLNSTDNLYKWGYEDNLITTPTLINNLQYKNIYNFYNLNNNISLNLLVDTDNKLYSYSNQQITRISLPTNL